MKVIENEVLVACDVDETIALWLEPTVPGFGKIEIEYAGKKVYLTPHQYHCDLLKTYKERGYHVTVWSANGWRHAKRIVEAFKLEPYVDVVQTKLTKYMDDSEDPGSILGARVFCPDITKEQPLLMPSTIINQDNFIIQYY
jgi:phosphoglycolate phosphatase-like HAD superfamily hydrolase